MKVFDYASAQQTVAFLQGKIEENSEEINKLQNSWKAFFSLYRQGELIRENELLIDKLDFILKQMKKSIDAAYAENDESSILRIYEYTFEQDNINQ